jgi:pimeloyl-ACP methyl ester carboxylesterase
MVWFLELIFIVLMLCILGLFLISLLFAWAWGMAQEETSLSVLDILAVASVEWGAFLTVAVAQLQPVRHFHEAPPLRDRNFSPQQLPVIFVPSLHLGAGLFRFLTWRLKKNFWNSLWLFQWKPFLRDPLLLEDQLHSFIEETLQRTQATRFRIVSFGTSRPIVANVLHRADLSEYCDKWIAISSPASLPKSLRFFSSAKAKRAYQNALGIEKIPDLLIVGENDFFCYPSSCWGESQQVVLPHVGHFGTPLHALCTQSVIRELQGS